NACAKITACIHIQPPDGGAVDLDKQAVDGLKSCVDPTTHGSEERAIPEPNQNERWSYKVRSIAAKPGCQGVLIGTQVPPGTVCQEDGCWWGTPPAPGVSCQGNVATVTTSQGTFGRDCSHSYTTCSTYSETGCTDRPRVACDPAGNDRCDGN